MIEQKRVEVFCLKCYETLNQHIRLQQCGHTFCFECVVPKAEHTTCPKCRVVNATYKISNGLTAAVQCMICQQETNQQQSQFSCRHQFCKNCIIKYWIEQIKSGNLRSLTQFKCPHCNSSEPFSEVQIYSLLPRKWFLKIFDRDKYQFLTECPNCSEIFNPVDEKNIKCPECHTVVCKVCRKEKQQNHICKQSYINYVINFLKIDIRYCPHCDEPCSKEVGCDHVRCCECGKQFCYFCMVDYYPIHRHGLSRHRRDCRGFMTTMEDNTMCKKCKVDCKPPEETLQDFVQRKNYLMQKDYLIFQSAPGFEFAEAEFMGASMFYYDDY